MVIISLKETYLMDNFQIETAQNIGIQQKIAGIGDRVLAFLIDLFILVVYGIISTISMSSLLGDRGETYMIYMVIGLPVFLYFLLWETFYNGQTPGKSIMKIRVVQLDGSRPRFSQYLIRWLLRTIDISLGSGSIAVVSILMSGKGQRLGDMAAKTTVISEKKDITIADTLITDISEDYKPRYPQVTILKDKDIQDIKAMFRKAKFNGNHHIIVTLSQKIADILEVTPEEKPIDFVEKIIKDYNYFTQK